MDGNSDNNSNIVVILTVYGPKKGSGDELQIMEKC
jgi:hypothetical protein